MPRSSATAAGVRAAARGLARGWHRDHEIVTRSGGKRLIRWNNSVLRATSARSSARRASARTSPNATWLMRCRAPHGRARTLPPPQRGARTADIELKKQITPWRAGGHARRTTWPSCATRRPGEARRGPVVCRGSAAGEAILVGVIYAAVLAFLAWTPGATSASRTTAAAVHARLRWRPRPGSSRTTRSIPPGWPWPMAPRMRSGTIGGCGVGSTSCRPCGTRIPRRPLVRCDDARSQRDARRDPARAFELQRTAIRRGPATARWRRAHRAEVARSGHGRFSRGCGSRSAPCTAKSHTTTASTRP